MKPSDRFRGFVKLINNCLDFIGYELLAPRMTFNIRTWGTIILITQFAVFCIRYMIIRVAVSWVEGLKAGIMMGGMMNGVTQVTTLILRRTDIRNLLLSIEQLIEDYEERSEIYFNALHKAFDRIQNISKVIRFGYLVLYLVMCMVPLVFLLYDGTRITIVQHELIGLPIEKNYGYIITFAIQFVNMFIAAVGFAGGDLLGMTCMTQIITFGDLLQIKANKLNDALDRKVKAREAAAVGAKFDGNDEIAECLLETIKWHQFLTDYSFKVDYIFNIMVTGQVFSAAISLLSTSCVNLNEFHMISAIYFVVTSYKLLVFCVVGTKIEYAYDQIYETVCNIHWEEMTGSQRKMFGMMLRMSQNAETMVMLGVMPLSMRTALQITKLIYSLTMMMSQNRT